MGAPRIDFYVEDSVIKGNANLIIPASRYYTLYTDHLRIFAYNYIILRDFLKNFRRFKVIIRLEDLAPRIDVNIIETTYLFNVKLIKETGDSTYNLKVISNIDGTVLYQVPVNKNKTFTIELKNDYKNLDISIGFDEEVYTTTVVSPFTKKFNNNYDSIALRNVIYRSNSAYTRYSNLYLLEIESYHFNIEQRSDLFGIEADYDYDSKRLVETYYSNEADPRIKAYVY